MEGHWQLNLTAYGRFPALGGEEEAALAEMQTDAGTCLASMEVSCYQSPLSTKRHC